MTSSAFFHFHKDECHIHPNNLSQKYINPKRLPRSKSYNVTRTDLDKKLLYFIRRLSAFINGQAKYIVLSKKSCTQNAHTWCVCLLFSAHLYWRRFCVVNLRWYSPNTHGLRRVAAAQEAISFTIGVWRKKGWLYQDGIIWHDVATLKKRNPSVFQPSDQCLLSLLSFTHCRHNTYKAFTFIYSASV